MTSILLAISDDQIRQQIISHIPANFRVVIREKGGTTEIVPGICVVDVAQWHDIAQWKHQNPLAELYCLLVATEEEMLALPQGISESLENIITTPFHGTELKIKLRSLVRMKECAEQQQFIQEKLALTNHALESITDAVIIADDEGRVIFANPAFVRFFDYTLNELNLRGIPSLLFHNRTAGMNIFETVRNNGFWKGDIELQRKNGEIAPFYLQVNTIRSSQGQRIGFISIGTDITDQKRIKAIEEEQRTLAEAQRDIAKTLTSTLDIKEVFSRILDNISRVVPNDAANIIIIQDGKAQLVDRENYAEKHMQALKAGGVPIEKYDDLRKILETKEPLIIPDTKQYLEEHDDMQSRSPWLNSHIGIPIRLHEEVIGFLNVDSIHPRTFTPHHAEQLEMFAEQATIAIQNAQLHEHEQQAATIEERQRLARNLHDAVSQTLFSANLIAEAIPYLWEKQPDAVLPRLKQIRELNHAALAKMRTLLLELHPERLLETQLIDLLQQLAEGVLGQTKINTILDLKKKKHLPPDAHIAFYYIAQEALNNVVKHAQAKNVTITLRETEWQTTMMIEDDGNGFDPDVVDASNLGLNNIRVRAQSINAELTVTSRIGRGTVIAVRWGS